MSRACAPDDVLGACVAVPLAICLPRVPSLLCLAWYWFLRSLFAAAAAAAVVAAIIEMVTCRNRVCVTPDDDLGEYTD
eukprot:COSAG05_NODE_3472_length_2039_cov_7.464948_2_plen_78_part_00